MAALDMKKHPEVLFKLQTYAKNEEFSIGASSTHTIVFILQGKVVVHNQNKEAIEFSSNTMFFCSAIYSPYTIKTTKKTALIELNVEYIEPFINTVTLIESIKKQAPLTQELDKLHIKKILRTFLSNVIQYGRNKISSAYLQNVKAKEFIYLMRVLYSPKATASFFSTITLSQNQFRATVLKNYSNHCTVNTLAKKCFMTNKTFTRKFKAEFGTTPYKWIVQEKAKSLEFRLTHPQFSAHDSMRKILEDFHFRSVSELTAFCQRENINVQLIKSKPK